MMIYSITTKEKEGKEWMEQMSKQRDDGRIAIEDIIEGGGMGNADKTEKTANERPKFDERQRTT